MNLRKGTAVAGKSPESASPVQITQQSSDPSAVPSTEADGSARERIGSRLSIAEGALALAILYGLIGAGIGAAAGSVLLGFIVGVAAGVAALGAILLMLGASAQADRFRPRVLRPFPPHLSR